MRALSGHRPWLGAVCGASFAVRVAVVLATPNFVPQTDAADFDRIAVSLATRGGFPASVATAHGGPTAFRPPMFPLVLSLVYRIVGVADAATRWEAGRLLEALLGAVAVGLLYLIVRRFWGDRAARVSGVIAAVYPPLLLVGSSLLSESLFIPVILAAVLAALVARDSGRLRWALLAGVLVGISALTRTNGFVVAIPLAFLVWTVRPRFSSRGLRAPLALLAATVLALVPWAVRNEHVFHEFVPTSTEGGFAVAGTYNPIIQGRNDAYPAFWAPPVLAMLHLRAAHPDENEAQMTSQLYTVGFRYIEAHPISLLRTAYWNTVRLLNLSGTGVEKWGARYEAYPPALAEISVYAFWLLAPFAVAGAIRGGAGRAPAAFWWCPAVLFLSVIPFLGDTRYRSPVDPFLVALAALALVPRSARDPSPA